MMTYLARRYEASQNCGDIIKVALIVNVDDKRYGLEKNGVGYVVLIDISLKARSSIKSNQPTTRSDNVHAFVFL